MPGERELDRRREDPQLARLAVVDEDGLGEAEVGGDGLAVGGRDRAAVEEDAEGVAALAVGAEEDAERVQGGHGHHGATARRRRTNETIAAHP